MKKNQILGLFFLCLIFVHVSCGNGKDDAASATTKDVKIEDGSDGKIDTLKLLVGSWRSLQIEDSLIGKSVAQTLLIKQLTYDFNEDNSAGVNGSLRQLIKRADNCLVLQMEVKANYTYKVIGTKLILTQLDLKVKGKNPESEAMLKLMEKSGEDFNFPMNGDKKEFEILNISNEVLKLKDKGEVLTFIR